MSNAETIAGLGGRIIGAARACGVDGGRLARIGQAMFDRVNQRARSAAEQGYATRLAAAAMEGGSAEVASGRTSCRDAREALDTMERDLARTR